MEASHTAPILPSWGSVFLNASIVDDFPDEIKAAIGEVAADAQAGESLGDLNRALTKIAELWHPHIQKEEAHLRPEEADVLIDLEEQIRLAKVFAEHSQAHSGPDYLVCRSSCTTCRLRTGRSCRRQCRRL